MCISLLAIKRTHCCAYGEFDAFVQSDTVHIFLKNASMASSLMNSIGPASIQARQKWPCKWPYSSQFSSWHRHAPRTRFTPFRTAFKCMNNSQIIEQKSSTCPTSEAAVCTSQSIKVRRNLYIEQRLPGEQTERSPSTSKSCWLPEIIEAFRSHWAIGRLDRKCVAPYWPGLTISTHTLHFNAQ